MRKEQAIGVDIGGGHIVCSAVDLSSGKLMHGTTSERKVNNKASKEEILACWSQAINDVLKQTNINELKGIGFAIPGPFNYQTGIAMYEQTDKYESLYNVPIKEAILPYLNIKETEMRFINDASAFAIGVAWFGKAKGTRKSISMTLGTGFGSAFIEDGVPIVDRVDVPDQGCLWHLPFMGGIADDFFSTRWFVRRYKELTGQSIAGVKEIASATKDIPDVKNIFLEFADNLSHFLSDWIKKFDPEILVMGGNIMGAGDLFIPRFKNDLALRNSHVDIAISELMEEAAMIGSARLLDDKYYDTVKDHLPTL